MFLISFVLYFVMLITVGLYSYLTQKKGTDFLLGNRTLNFWVTAIATNATDMSLWLFMGYPAFIYTKGLPGIWTAVGLIIGMILNWHFIAPALRTATEKLGASTITEFFEKRYNDKTGILTLVSAIMSLIFFTLYISAGIVAFGRLFNTILELNYIVSITLGTIIVTLYTFLGGFIAVSLNNFLKGIFILIAVMAVPIIAFGKAGGVAAIMQAAQQQHISLSLFTNVSAATFWGIFVGILSWGLSYFGQLHILVNFMGINDVREIHKAKYLSTAWQIIALGSATITGLIGLAYFKAGSINPELIFITLTRDLFSPLWSGFILCSVLAAGVATIAIQILLSGSTLAHDLYKKFLHPQANAQQMTIVTRCALILVSICSWLLALNSQEKIYELVKYAWTGLGCSFGPLVICSLYAKNITNYGAIAGILVGGTSVLCSSWLGFETSDPKIPFALSLIAIYIASYLTKSKA